MEAVAATKIAVIKKSDSGLVLVPVCGHGTAGRQQGAQGRAVRSSGLHTPIVHELHAQRAVPPKHRGADERVQRHQEVAVLGSP